jgi:hypothetical protein
MPHTEFELAIPGSERPQTHALDHTTIGVGNYPTDYLNNETHVIRSFVGG